MPDICKKLKKETRAKSIILFQLITCFPRICPCCQKKEKSKFPWDPWRPIMTKLKRQNWDIMEVNWCSLTTLLWPSLILECQSTKSDFQELELSKKDWYPTKGLEKNLYSKQLWYLKKATSNTSGNQTFNGPLYIQSIAASRIYTISWIRSHVYVNLTTWTARSNMINNTKFSCAKLH